MNKKGVRALSSKLKSIQILNSKRSFEMAITTLIVIVLGILVLIALALALTGGFDNLMRAIRGYSGTDADNLVSICQSQCDLSQENSFCCEEKLLGKEKTNCQDERLKIDCSLDCEGVCES